MNACQNDPLGQDITLLDRKRNCTRCSVEQCKQRKAMQHMTATATTRTCPDCDLTYPAHHTNHVCMPLPVWGADAPVPECPRTPSALDTQVAGSHYKDMVIQPVEFITRNNIGFLPGCVIKRVCRYRAKAGAQDLRKAIHELQLLLELEYPGENAK